MPCIKPFHGQPPEGEPEWKMAARGFLIKSMLKAQLQNKQEQCKKKEAFFFDLFLVGEKLVILEQESSTTCFLFL